MVLRARCTEIVALSDATSEYVPCNYGEHTLEVAYKGPNLNLQDLSAWSLTKILAYSGSTALMP